MTKVVKIMKIAFVCWRPLEVFTTINIVMSEKLHNVDIYVQASPYLTVYKDGLEKIGLFAKIVWFRDYDYKSKYIHIQSRMGYMFPSFELTHQTDSYIPVNDYDVIYSSGWNHFFIALANYNKQAKIAIFEDGTGAYFPTNYLTRINRSKLEQKILSLFGRGILSVRIDVIKVYLPELIDFDVGGAIVQAITTPSSEVLEIEKVVFGTVQNLYSDAELIYMESDEKKYDPEIIFQCLSSYQEHVVIRSHPASTRDLNQYALVLDRSYKSTWELIAGESICESNILVGYCSTAQLIPYILYKKRPYLVYTYGIFCKDELHKNDIRAFINKFKKFYNNRIFEPETIEDFCEVIHTLLKNHDKQ